MSALFNFHSFLTVVLLGICACTYVKMQFPALLEQRTGFRGVFWKAARIAESISGVNTLAISGLWQRMTSKDGAFYAAALPRIIWKSKMQNGVPLNVASPSLHGDIVISAVNGKMFGQPLFI